MIGMGDVAILVIAGTIAMVFLALVFGRGDSAIYDGDADSGSDRGWWTQSRRRARVERAARRDARSSSFGSGSSWKSKPSSWKKPSSTGKSFTRKSSFSGGGGKFGGGGASRKW